MTNFGVTPTGFTRKTFADIQSSVFGYWRSKISKYLGLTEKTVLGNVGNGVVAELDQLWRVAEACYYAGDPDNQADPVAFEAMCAITGTQRKNAKRGYWSAMCLLQAGKTYAPGALVANVDGQATNRWSNRDEVVTGVAGNYPVLFQSEKASAAAVGAAGTLVIAQPIDGWIDVTTTVDATSGQDVESIDELALRRPAELTGTRSGVLGAIMSRVSKVPGVLSVRSIENKSDDYLRLNANFVVPPHSYRIVIWDGVSPAALNNDVAAAIVAANPAGIWPYGESAGTANGQTVPFDRALQVPIYVTCTVLGTATVSDIRNAVKKAGASQLTGNNVVAAKIRASITDTPGVTDLLAFAIGTAPAPVGAANIPIPITAIALFEDAQIDVTFA